MRLRSILSVRAFVMVSGSLRWVRCYKTDSGPAIFRLEEHVTRLKNSAKMLYLNISYSIEELAAALVETVRVNRS